MSNEMKEMLEKSKLAIVYMGEDDPPLMKTGEFLILQNGEPLGMVQKLKLDLDAEHVLAGFDIEIHDPEKVDDT
jgi:hypothetical protein